MTTRLLAMLSPLLLHSEPGAGSGSAAPPNTTPPPDSETEESVVDTGVDYAALAEPSDEDDEPAELPAEPAATPEPSPAAAPPAASPPLPAAAQPPVQPTTPVVAATPAAQPAPAAAPAQAPAAPAAPSPQAPAAVTPESIEAAYNQYQANILPQLEKHYALSAEQARELDENPAAAIPKMMARVHYQAHIAAYTGIMSQLPHIVGSVLEQNRKAETAVNQFYDRWKDLKKPQYEKQVDAGLRAFRAANPDMPFDQFVEKSGLMLMISLGLNPQPTAPDPVLPVAPFQAPARPAAPSGAGPARSPQGATDFWADLTKDDDE